MKGSANYFAFSEYTNFFYIQKSDLKVVNWKAASIYDSDTIEDNIIMISDASNGIMKINITQNMFLWKTSSLNPSSYQTIIEVIGSNVYVMNYFMGAIDYSTGVILFMQDGFKKTPKTDKFNIVG